VTTAPTSSSRSPGAKGVRKVRRGPLTRKQILDASLRLFSQRGFARTSVRDIAQAAGITDAAIYYHFASKRDLFEALFEERGITPAIAGLEQASVAGGAVDAGPPLEVFTEISLRALDIMERNRDFLRVMFMGAMGQDRTGTDEYRRIVGRWARAGARILREYVDKGQLRPVDVDAAARQLVMLVIGAFLDDVMSTRGSGARDGASESLAAAVRQRVRYLLEGLQA
jgi:AcrR family transcriptional regulator